MRSGYYEKIFITIIIDLMRKSDLMQKLNQLKTWLTQIRKLIHHVKTSVRAISANLESCRIRNQKEQRLCENKLGVIQDSEQVSLHQLSVDRIKLRQRLAASRKKVFHSNLKKGLDFSDRFAVMEKYSNFQTRSSESLFERSKGFSKVEIKDDSADDLVAYQALKRSQTIAAASKLSKTEASDDKLPVKNWLITDKDVFVLYPTERNLNLGKSVLSIAELEELRRRPLYNYGSSKPTLPYHKTRDPVLDDIPQSIYPKPKYVSHLERVACVNFDQYTDGTMHLAERRLMHRRKEYMPTELGHLPVRKRNMVKKLQPDEESYRLRLPPGKLTGLPAKNIKVYIPKSVHLERQVADQKEFNSFLKVKQEDQAVKYAEVLAMTSTFLGKEPEAKKLVNFPDLTRQEKAMLEQIRKNRPTLKTTATIVTWLTKSLHKTPQQKLN